MNNITATRFFVIKDGKVEGFAANKSAAIDMIRTYQAKETHPFLKAEFSIIEGKEEFIPYLKAK